MSARISIVTPSLNQGRTIEQTIISVLEQEYENWEHIVVDGGSNDQTVNVLERYGHLRWTSEPDRGQTDAINKGLAQTSGDIFAYINSDDVYRPGAFQRVAEAFADPSCNVLVGDCDEIDADGSITGLYRARLDRPEDLLRYWSWGECVTIAQPAVFLRRQALDEVGPFDESYDMAMDLEMWLRLARRYRFTLIPQVLAGFRVTADTKTSRRRLDMTLDSYRAAGAYLDLAPAESRAGLASELRRETAGHLLTAARVEPHRSREAAWQAVRCRPAVLHSPRTWRALLGWR